MSVFEDQKTFMEAGDQTTDRYNQEQLALYVNLIKEELQEFEDAGDNRVEQLDALIDILVVTVGAIHSAGFDGEGAWNEVMRSNFTKINPLTGKVNKREDGKILKGPDYSPPNLEPFVTKG